ncbi:MAG: immune inhibitor A [Anaerolineae bacterium]|nr:immune inhibitor A [Anaerolineae bacterium]
MSEKQNKQDTWLWIGLIVGGLILALCICVVVVGAAVVLFGVSVPFASQTGAVVLPTPYVMTVEPEIGGSTVEILPSEEPPAEPAEPPTTTETVVPAEVEGFNVELPVRDRYDLASRFLGIDEVEPIEPVEYEVGDVIPFWVDNEDMGGALEVQAELVYIAENVYMWVEEGATYDYDDMVASAERFSQETYPTNRAFFGSEASPGIDGDPRLHILHSISMEFWVAGYFFSPSSYPASIVPYSNEKEVFFINLSNTPPGDEWYDGVLAHEFQHMIHMNIDQNEEIWLNEGMSEMAAYLNGYGPSDMMILFAWAPDLPLTYWPEGGGDANYGASYLYAMYFLERFGQDGLKALVANPLNGMEGVDDTLEQIGMGINADQFFMDWTVANLLNDPSLEPGIYGYPSLRGVDKFTLEAEIGSYPYDTGWTDVNQFGTDYYRLEQPGTVTVTFEGNTQAPVVPVDTVDTDGDPATNDQYVWWSNRGDDSDMMLTHPVDLTGVDEAVLEYDLWYWIEALWDYGYLTVSTDGGATWEMVETPYTTTEDPHGNSYGAGYTGLSLDQADADADGWLHESIDLSAYAGQEILIRFEMITDDAVNQPGMAVDNVCVEAIGWCDNVEDGVGEWEARGFLRHDNVLPQRYGIQLVTVDGNTVEVSTLALDENNRGEWTFEIGRGEQVTLVVSGMTRYTTEQADYQLTVAPAD